MAAKLGRASARASIARRPKMIQGGERDDRAVTLKLDD